MRLPSPDVATFRGVHNGRPRFDFGLTVPPKWLMDDIRSGRIRMDGDKCLIDGKPLAQGARVERLP